MEPSNWVPHGTKQNYDIPLEPIVASIDTHTMGDSLYKYLHMKVHPDIQEKNWAKIIVKGCHDRSPTSSIASIEKCDKPFNWQRPTTSYPSPDVLELQCFPGFDYVEHYAAIVATYLALQKKSPDVVSYYMPTPLQRVEPLVKSNLRDVGIVDIAIIGYVHELHRFTSGAWQGDDDNELFSWQILTMPNGSKVAFIGCRICFWGDIGGNVVRALQQLNRVKCTIYIGKLGTLQPQYKPNTLLATGNSSVVYGVPVTWKSVLADATLDSKLVQQGAHYSIPSVLSETKTWLSDKRDSFDWVDPEIGHMALASLEGNTRFGYLHIVSDNLAHKYPYDLSNERVQRVIQDRRRLFEEIEVVLDKFFRSWDSRAA
jgi:hypothetical protein